MYRTGLPTCLIGIMLLLTGCQTVPGTAVPVPETIQKNKNRFVEVAPATTTNPRFQASPAIAYDLGSLVARSEGGDSQFISQLEDHIFITPVKGWIRYPLASLSLTTTAQKFPIIILLHGHHNASDPSYQGYDYLAQDLATQGYVAISIDANAVNGISFSTNPNSPTGGKLEVYGGLGDTSSQSRAQLVLGTLDRLRDINKYGDPGMLDQLQGKLDFSRIGIMGHSRGGQGISNTLKYNLTRRGVSQKDLEIAIAKYSQEAKEIVFRGYPELISTVKPDGEFDWKKFESALKTYNIFYAATAESRPVYDFKAALMLAPTDFSGSLGLVNVPFSVVLPSCDGDVSNLQGAWLFDHNRYSMSLDGAARYQVFMHGANHNFYNTVWSADDAEGHNNQYCKNRAGGVRLTAEDQRRSGQFIINSFMRHFVGGEQQFAAYWNGMAQLPSNVCPDSISVCDERILLSVQKSVDRSKVIHRFDQDDSLRRNSLGGALALTGFDEVATCRMPLNDESDGRIPLGACVPMRLKDFGGFDLALSNGLFSIADHLQLSWSKPNAALITELNGLSTEAYDTLTLRVAVVRPIGQEMIITLTDAKGFSASVTASDYSDALYLMPKAKGNGRPMIDDKNDEAFIGSAPQLLNMVAIPLAAFSGIDIKKLSQLKISLPKNAGKIAIADIQLQNMQRP